MFNVLKINESYSFDLDGNYQLNGFIQNHDNSDEMKIVINQKIFYFSRKWLGLISHYEVDLPLEHILKIKFVECRSKVIGLKCSNLMVFDERIEVSDSFFVVPGFTRFCVNEEGVVKSIKTGRVLKPSISSYGYPYVNVYDADKKRWRSVCLHILLARTFVRNRDPGLRFFVNHKDGNKLNFKITNLEWVTSLENQEHAVKSGLRFDNKPCKMLDVLTGAVSNHESLSSALKSIGMKVSHVNIVNVINGEVIPALIKKRFEIKFYDDSSDWYYKKKSINFLRNKQIGPFEGLNVNTHEVYEARTIRELSAKLGISCSAIEDNLRSSYPRSTAGYSFRTKSLLPWPETFIATVPRTGRSFIATNIDTCETLSFDSIRKLCLHIGLDKRTLKNRIKEGKPYNSWKFEEVKRN